MLSSIKISDQEFAQALKAERAKLDLPAGDQGLKIAS